jgi:hypothetical protein
MRAVTLARLHPSATLYVTAGWMKNYQAFMKRIYKECLIANGVPEHRIDISYTAPISKRTGSSNTRGEAKAFPTLFQLPLVASRDTHHVHAVDRDFHLARTMLLLRARPTAEELRRTIFHEHPVESRERAKNLVRERVAYVNDWLYVAGEKRRRKSG